GQPNRAEVVSPKFVDTYIPLLKNRASKGALLWHDVCLKDPDKFGALIRHRYERHGGVCALGNQVSQITKEGKIFRVETLNGNTFKARTVVNATGPWIEPFQKTKIDTKEMHWCRAI